MKVALCDLCLATDTFTISMYNNHHGRGFDRIRWHSCYEHRDALKGMSKGAILQELYAGEQAYMRLERESKTERRPT